MVFMAPAMVVAVELLMLSKAGLMRVYVD